MSKEIADRIVAQGVGRQHSAAIGRYWVNECDSVVAAKFIIDPRVCMALMEKCSNVHLMCGFYWDDTGYWCDVVVGHGKHMKRGSCDSPQVDPARAITLACLAALEAE